MIQPLTVEEIEDFERRLKSGLMSAEEKAELSRLLAHVPPAPPPIPFKDFVAAAKPEYRWWWYNEILAQRLVDVAEGRIRRLMIFMPPRMGKSELASKLFPAWVLHQFPARKVGLVSYNEGRAFEYARDAQRYLLAAGGRLRSERDEEAVRQAHTQFGGELWAAGIGGSLTGLGFHIGILDDPVKNSQEAASPVIQRRNSLWWSSTFYTRAEPNAAIIVIQTRWHPKDLSGFLLERERVAAAGLEDPDADAAMLGAQQWHILAFDHERDPDTPWTLEDKDTPTTFPITCTVEPDPRAKGELLNPDRFPPEAVAAMRAQGSYTFSALQQQRPRAQEGNRFKAEWFPIVDATPAQVVKRVRYWDLAGTDPSQSADGEPDFTCGVRMSRGNDGLFYVEHVTRGQWSVARRDAHMKVSADADAAEFGVVLPDGTRAPNRTAVPQWHERESGIGGSERTRALSRALAGHIVHSDPPIGDKMSRAEPFAGQAEVGNVRLVKGDWNAAFIDELCAFPFGANDDTVDAASGAFAKVSDETSDIVTFTPGAVPVFSPFTV